MLSIRHIRNDGRESVSEATSVDLAFERTRPGSVELAIHTANDDINLIGDGLVYVMNSAGRTVATYDLDAIKAPASRGMTPKGAR